MNADLCSAKPLLWTWARPNYSQAAGFLAVPAGKSPEIQTFNPAPEPFP
jgi:hypothetical protein